MAKIGGVVGALAGAGGFAILGAEIGALGGPAGAAIGGIIGGTAGLIGGYFAGEAITKVALGSILKLGVLLKEDDLTLTVTE